MSGNGTGEPSKPAADEPAVEGAEGVEQSSDPLFIAAEGEHDAERFDAVAGCEFVDDRIRLRE